MGKKGYDATGHVLYHIRGGAKVEISMMGDKVLDIENTFKERCILKRAKGEKLRELVDRKQREGESIT